MLIAALLLAVSCGGGKKDKESCPDGYEWVGTDCVKSGSGDTGDTSDTGTDTGVQPDDGDTADDTEPDDDSDTEDDSEQSDYNGSCTEIRNGDSYEINVETKKLTIGTIKVNGQSDDAALFGEIWAENRETLSEFKIGDINSEFSGKTMNIPKGRYSFAFKPVSSANKVAIEGLDNIDMSSGDRTLDFDLPLFHFTGKVVNNEDSVFTVEEAYQESTQLVLKTGTFEKIIPYSEFAGYDLLLPKGTYSVSFKGQLASGQGVFEGTVLSSSQGIDIEDDTERDIKVQTVTFAGSIVKDGYEVSGGQLVLVENPPLSSVSAVVAADLSATSYNIAVTAGADLNLLYLPEAGSYPVRYIKLETWNAQTETPSSHNITLDFGRVHGKITFMGGNTFPTVSNCSGADCTIGKLKATGFDNSSFVVKDLGTELPTDGEGNVTDITYEALLVRRIAVTTANDVVNYNPKIYTINFESNLNDIKEGFKSLPFTVPAKYENSAGAMVSSFSFRVVNEDDTETWLTEKELNLDIVPSKISGTVTLNGSTFAMEDDDLIKLKDESGMEYAVVNLSELQDGKYSFYAPDGNYNVIYEGKGLLSSDFKTYIAHDFEIEGNISNHEFAIKTGKITLDFNVNGTPLADWAEGQKGIEDIGLAVNIDKTASDFVLDLTKKDGKYAAEVLTGSVVNAYLEVAFADKVASEKSYSRIRLLSGHNMTSGTTVKDDLTLVEAGVSVKLNGKAVTASDYAAKFRIHGVNSSEIYCPASGDVKFVVKKGEYKSPTPELSLNEGFDAKHDIPLSCLYFGE